MLSFPLEWLPDVPLDLARVSQAVAAFRWIGFAEPTSWVEQEDLIVVGKYLVGYGTTVYWDIILRGGMRGYSLYLHELMELRWFNLRRLNPFDQDVQREYYEPAHSWALLFEHRFLQVVAGMKGYTFTMRELILGNPLGDPPERDWNDLLGNQGAELSAADQEYHADRMPLVAELYNLLGYRE